MKHLQTASPNNLSSKAPGQLFPGMVVIGLLALALVPHIFFFGATDWEKVYVPAAARLMDGKNIFAESFVYPPSAALLAVPCVGRSETTVRCLVFLMNWVGIVVVIMGGWSVAGGRFWLRPPWQECAIAVIGLITAFGFTFDVLVNRQNDLIVGGCTIAGCWLILRGYALWGAVAIGLGAALKCTPLLFAPYLLWSQGPWRFRSWRLPCVIVTTAVLANLLVDVAFPPRTNVEAKPQAQGVVEIRLVEWAQKFLIPQTQARPGEWYADIGFNHSLSGLINRLALYRLEWSVEDWSRIPRGDGLGANALRWTVYILMVILITIAAVVTCPSLKQDHERELRQIPIGIGMTLCLMLLLSPMSSKPHFCVLVVPAWCLARQAIISRTRHLLAFSIAGAILGVSANKDLMGDQVYSWLLWHGNIPIATVILFFGLCFCAKVQNRPT